MDEAEYKRLTERHADMLKALKEDTMDEHTTSRVTAPPSTPPEQRSDASSRPTGGTSRHSGRLQYFHDSTELTKLLVTKATELVLMSMEAPTELRRVMGKEGKSPSRIEFVKPMSDTLMAAHEFLRAQFKAHTPTTVELQTINWGAEMPKPLTKDEFNATLMKKEDWIGAVDDPTRKDTPPIQDNVADPPKSDSVATPPRPEVVDPPPYYEHLQ